MNLDKQFEALAKHEGWRLLQTGHQGQTFWGRFGRIVNASKLPDYNDERNLLRIVRGLGKEFTDPCSPLVADDFILNLKDILGLDAGLADLGEIYWMLCATTPQLREALLKATGGWEDE